MATRFEVHMVATIPHGVEVTPEQLTAELNDIESVFQDMGGDISITFARTTRGKDGEADDRRPNTMTVPASQGGFL